jgi:hypothetical protein
MVGLTLFRVLREGLQLWKSLGRTDGPAND